jgi:hypothetical protein
LITTAAGACKTLHQAKTIAARQKRGNIFTGMGKESRGDKNRNRHYRTVIIQRHPAS